MIVGEAKTDAEATEFAQVAKTALDDRGYTNAISPDGIKLGVKESWARYPAVWEDGKIIAVGVCTDYNGIKGLGTLVELFMPAKDYPDPNLALDTLALYYLNILASQGKYIIKAVLPASFSPDYYTKMLELEVEVTGRNVNTDEPSIIFWGTTKSILQAILKRRPEWELSL